MSRAEDNKNAIIADTERVMCREDGDIIQELAVTQRKVDVPIAMRRFCFSHDSLAAHNAENFQHCLNVT